MITVYDIGLNSYVNKKEIEATFKHPYKQRDEVFKYCIPSKFSPMFYSNVWEICDDMVVAGEI